MTMEQILVVYKMAMEHYTQGNRAHVPTYTTFTIQNDEVKMHYKNFKNPVYKVTIEQIFQKYRIVFC